MSHAAIAIPEAHKSAPGRSTPRGRSFLFPVGWSVYRELADSKVDRNVRFNFLRGKIEMVVTTSFEHENISRLIEKLIFVLVEHLLLPLTSGGSATLRQQLADAGMEPDSCFWIARAAAMRGKRKFNADRDPPPDLAVEVEISRNILDRLAILAALRVPEVWRCSDSAVVCLLLDEAGQYTESPISPALGNFEVARLNPFLAMRAEIDEPEIVRQFRQNL